MIGPERAKLSEKKGEKDKPAEAPKPKASASASAGPAVAPPPSQPITAVGPRVYVTITNVAVAGGNNDRLPKDVIDLLEKLRGSVVSFTMTDTGAADFRRDLANPDDATSNAPVRDIALRSLEDALSGMYVPTPPKPIGAGGYYIVADRVGSLGVEVIRYRVFKVTKVNGNTASIALDLKQYATGPKLDLPQLGEKIAKLPLSEYTVQGKGFLDVVPDRVFAKAAAYDMPIQAILGGDKGTKGTLAMEIRAQLGDTLPEGLPQQGPDDQPN
jgi:hypothetical protein